MSVTERMRDLQRAQREGQRDAERIRALNRINDENVSQVRENQQKLALAQALFDAKRCLESTDAVEILKDLRRPLNGKIEVFPKEGKLDFDPEEYNEARMALRWNWQKRSGTVISYDPDFPTKKKVEWDVWHELSFSVPIDSREMVVCAEVKSNKPAGADGASDRRKLFGFTISEDKMMVKDTIDDAVAMGLFRAGIRV